LVRYSLLIEKIKQAFPASDADLLAKGYAFSQARAGGPNTELFQAADLLLDQDADAVTIAGALIPPLLWQGLAGPDAVRKPCGRAVAATLEDLNSLFILRVDTRRYHRVDVHALNAGKGKGIPENEPVDL